MTTSNPWASSSITVALADCGPAVGNTGSAPAIGAAAIDAAAPAKTRQVARVVGFGEIVVVGMTCPFGGLFPPVMHAKPPAICVQ
jgi:hypothetical protein